MPVSRQEGDTYVNGNLSAKTMGIPAGTVDNAAVSANAAIDATKLQQQYALGYAQESDTTAADEARVLHGAFGATGSIVSFEVGSVVANIGASVVDVDLLKNGTSVFTTVPQLTSSHTAYEMLAGTVSTTSFVDGDILEVDIDATVGGGTLAKGIFVTLIIRETPQ